MTAPRRRPEPDPSPGSEPGPEPRPDTRPHPYLSRPPVPRVLAHRGLVTADLAADGVLENTAAAMDAAVAAGARYLESDVRLSRDGVVVLAHDADLRRTLGDPRRIDALTARELSAMFADRGGLLTLADALERYPDRHLNIDIKSADVAEPAGRILGRHPDRVLIASFADPHRQRALAAARAAHPRGERPAISLGSDQLLRVLRRLLLRRTAAAARALAGFDAMQIPERRGPVPVLTPRLIELAHRAGVEVHVWTVNDPARMR